MYSDWTRRGSSSGIGRHKGPSLFEGSEAGLEDGFQYTMDWGWLRDKNEETKALAARWCLGQQILKCLANDDMKGTCEFDCEY